MREKRERRGEVRSGGGDDVVGVERHVDIIATAFIANQPKNFFS